MLKKVLRELDDEIDYLMNRLQPRIERNVNRIRFGVRSRIKTDG